MRGHLVVNRSPGAVISSATLNNKSSVIRMLRFRYDLHGKHIMLNMILIHLPLVPHICVSESCQN